MIFYYYSWSVGFLCTYTWPSAISSLLYLSNAIGRDFYPIKFISPSQVHEFVSDSIRSSYYSSSSPTIYVRIGIRQYPSSYLFRLIQVINFRLLLLLLLPVDYNCCKSILNHIIIIIPVAIQRFILLKLCWMLQHNFIDIYVKTLVEGRKERKEFLTPVGAGHGDTTTMITSKLLGVNL